MNLGETSRLAWKQIYQEGVDERQCGFLSSKIWDTFPHNHPEH